MPDAVTDEAVRVVGRRILIGFGRIKRITHIDDDILVYTLQGEAGREAFQVEIGTDNIF